MTEDKQQQRKEKNRNCHESKCDLVRTAENDVFSSAFNPMPVDTMPLWAFLIQANRAVAFVFAEKLARGAAYVPNTIFSRRLKYRKRVNLRQRIEKWHTWWIWAGFVLKAWQLVFEAVKGVFKGHCLHEKVEKFILRIRAGFNCQIHTPTEIFDCGVPVHRDNEIFWTDYFWYGKN